MVVRQLVRSLATLLLAVGALVLIGPAPVAAQQPAPKPQGTPTIVQPQAQPCGPDTYPCPPPPSYSVGVEPGLAIISRAQNSPGLTASFTVSNLGSETDTYTFSCSATGGVTCVSVSPSSATLQGSGGPAVAAAGTQAQGASQPEAGVQCRVDCGGTGSVTVTVTYNLGLPSGNLYLTATGLASQQGWYQIQAVPSVIVTPDGETLAPLANAAASQRFDVRSNRSAAAMYSLSVACAGTATGCSISPTSLSLAPGTTGAADVTYNVGALGSSGRVTLRAMLSTDATQQDTGWVSVTAGSGLPISAGPVAERSLCLTIAMGSGAAYECGDLRLVHTLPAVRSLNKSRAPVLLYNSQHAHPYPIVSADVQMPSADPLPTTVEATVKINDAQYVRSWSGAEWGSPGQTRRVVVGFDAAWLATGIYDYTLEVRRVTSSGNTVLQDAVGKLAVVNRSASPFGPGWWLAGYERLYFIPGPEVMWVGGDGSVRRYGRVGPRGIDTAYVAAPLDAPDTLLHTSTNEWVRLLPGGDRVTFDTTGFHRWTTTRLGYRTEFVNSDGLLTRVLLPPAGSGLEYRFQYSGTPARLEKVLAPDTAVNTWRVTALNRGGDSLRVVDFTGTPDSTVVVLAHEPGTNRVVGRRDRRRALTVYTYDAAFRVTSSRLDVPGAGSIIRSFCGAETRGLAACSPTLVAPDSAYTAYDGPRVPSDSADVMHFWLDRFGAPWKIRDPYSNITTLARADARWPALATRVRSPNGRVVAAAYDARGNVTEVNDSVRFWRLVVPPCHEPPCMPGTMVESTTVTTTRYAWDPKWDQVTQITLPNGQLTRFSYDPNNGNRDWQEDGRGLVSRVTFGYVASGNGAGLLRSVTVPGGATDSVFYDGFGNVERTKTPLGWVTYHVNDRLGRTALVRTPVNAAQTLFRHDSTHYNRRGLPHRNVSYGPAMSYESPAMIVPEQRVIVQRLYNEEGQLRQLDRRVTPDTTKVLKTRWEYDVAARQTVEIDAASFRDSASYDPAGNIVRIVSRRRAGVAPTELVYDRLNRLVTRITSGFVYGRRHQTLSDLDADSVPGNQPFNRLYPWFSDEPDGNLRIAGDTAVFRYDAMGNLTEAKNRWARIRRTYTQDGLTDRDSLWIRNYGDTAFGHAYGIGYSYDVNRRVTNVEHPSQLRPGASSGTTYSYDSLSGELTTVTDALGNTFQFTYTARGDRIRTSLPGAIVDTAAYDLDGRLLTHWFKNYNTSSQWRFPSPTFRSSSLTYADPVRVASSASSAGYRENTVSRYTGLGHLAWLRTTSYGDIAGSTALLTNLETFTLDGLGSTLSSKDSTSFAYENDWQPPSVRRRAWSYQASTGRLTLVADSLRADTAYRHDGHHYDEAGNLFMTKTEGVNQFVQPVFEERASYFDADNRLTFVESRRLNLVSMPSSCWDFPSPGLCWELQWPWRVAFEEYRYDALGRRVLVRTRQDCGTFGQTSLRHCNIGTIRRTVWDGSRELYEIQQYGGSGSTDASAEQMENDTSTTISFVRPGTHPIAWDPNPQFGRVAYTHGPSIDQPLGAIRIALVDTALAGSDRARRLWAPFTIVPHWNWRGRADYGTLGDGGTKLCWTATSSRCIGLVWQAQPFVFMSTDADTATRWFGTLLTMKRDGSGLHFKRNRYLDPNTGRFTQEDPIGLAGGLNLYGFAAGDPVNFSDPFGLSPCGQKECPPWFWRRLILDWVAEQARIAGEFLGGIIEEISPFSPKAMTGVDFADPTRQVGTGERLLAQADATSKWLGLGFLRRGVTGRLTNSQAKDLAEYLGFRRVRGAPFSSHGQSVFWNGRNYITQDIDSHIGGVWKMFDRAGNRLGSFDELLINRLGP